MSQSPHNDSSEPRSARLWEALIPVVLLVVFLSYYIIELKGENPHLPLIGGTIIAGVMAWRLGYKWGTIQDGIIGGIMISMQAILILMLIGMLISTWIASGIVPAMIFYGLELLSPTYFFFAACIICAVVSLATGSSWTTAGTVGVALIGISDGLGLPLPITAGAIISGAYFGDKMSPLSDSTNLAAVVGNAELFEHIRHMIYTTLPALIIALILYLVIGLNLSVEQAEQSDVLVIMGTLEENFTIHWLLLTPVLLVILIVYLRIAAIPALLGGILLGCLVAMTVQNVSFGKILEIAHSGYSGQTEVQSVDDLLNRGGLQSMMWTVSLIICALSFGGVMEKSGMLKVIALTILKKAHTTGSLVVATVATCIGANIVAADQYLALILPGRMYQSAYAEAELAPKNLSRVLEDSGTLTSPLIPWNTCGATMIATLGVMPWVYVPYCFLNLITPIVSIIYGFTGITMTKAKQESTETSA